ncbi:hypothetical protein [Thermococcus sibiricus]|uniref:Uncharacterized protein n=1 Tax=Thermococcus sibiricus (strain DSM 12597 / MM 739) TaxID=604354 RepID=C6A020_THESM|nr:hypothetical protein [Thermococcus sibiricus]ACS91001.1 hypothetical protein TSIB_1952 [Thermococcus sibiricus MM 739]
MGEFAEMLEREFGGLKTHKIYSTQLGNRSIEILEVEAKGSKLLVMFQDEPMKHDLRKWSLIITSAKNTRTIQGMDKVDTLKMRINENVRSILEGM